MVATESSILPEWVVSLFTNLGLYFVLFGIGYILLKQVQKNPPATGNTSPMAKLKRFMVFGPLDEDEDVEINAPPKAEEPQVEWSFGVKALVLFFCTFGLLASYLIWGLLQERIMTSKYGVEEEKFRASTFLVFCNRFLALSVALVVTNVTTQPKLKAPFYKFSFTSLSNVLSSWCQLEALKYVTFPTQVLAKSSKLIPVMIMGKFISNKKYPWYEYGVAVAIAFGVAIFMLSQEGGGDNAAQQTTVSGLFILLGYLTFDSFTSQWQSHLFSSYKMSSYQMMLGVNAFSTSLTFISLVQSGDLFYSIDFCQRHPEIFFEILGFSATGATGQMFIFYTIKTFGPLVFTLIMTTRQLVSIILSCFFFGHEIDANGVAGAAVVFSAVSYKIYRSNYEKKMKKQREMEMKIQNETRESETQPLTKG